MSVRNGFMGAVGFFFLSFFCSAYAEVVSSSPEHFVVKHQVSSTLSPAQVWQKLIHPSRWWHSDHTYSGDANNLSLDLQAGGLWREDWEGGSVAHGTVLYVQNERVLRLDAPFGPMQGLGVSAVWTISIKPQDKGSLITFDLNVNGSSASNLDSLASAVDSVKGAAIKSLARAH